MSDTQTFVRFLVGEIASGSPVPHFTRADWEQLIRIATRANLLALLHYRIVQTQSEIPTDLQQIVRDYARQATAESLQKRAELTRVLGKLNGSGITPILFKGTVLAHTVYPSYTHRSMGDIDLWIPREQMEQAKELLESLGYMYKEKEHRPHAMQALGDGELQMRGQTSLFGLIELHYGVFPGEWLRITTQIDRTAVYERLVASRICDQPVLCLAAEDAFIQIALHVGINHRLTTHSLRGLIDLEFLARQGLDWATVSQRCQEWRVYTAVSLVIDLWNQLFASEQSTQAATTIPFHRQRLLRFFIEAQDVIEGNRLVKGQWRFFYQLALVDRGRDAWRLITHTLWPDQTWLKARYADVQVWTRLHHFKQIISGEM